MDAEKNLGSQQQHLLGIEYDLRISNLADFICSKIDTSARTLIDMGAGNGLFLKYFKKQGFHISGMELEHDQVKRMKKDPQLANENIVQGDILNSKGKESYDVVIASDVIEHIEDDQNAVIHLWSFVKKGGQMIITVPAHQYLYGKRDVAWGHFRRYSKELLTERVEKLGGTLEFIGYWNLIGYFVYYLYEKILRKQINEEMRYSRSLISRLVRALLDRILKWEKSAGGVPIGLTLVAVVRK
jgi:SAM-dependent methyltransferase